MELITKPIILQLRFFKPKTQTFHNTLHVILEYANPHE